jgi:hypothetical protein
MKTYQLEPAGARPAEQFNLHIARRTMTPSTLASANCGGGDSAADLSAACLRSAAARIRTPLPEASRPSEPVPIWLAVLRATSCQARRNGEHHAVRWSWVSGRALYTNVGRDAEHIEPLGVSLLGGHTMTVYWMPGETAYTVEVSGRRNCVPDFEQDGDSGWADHGGADHDEGKTATANRKRVAPVEQREYALRRGR